MGLSPPMSLCVLRLLSRHATAICRSVCGYTSAQRMQWMQRHMASSPPEPNDEVLMSKIGDKGVITMNRPKVLNALSISMIRQMTAQLKKWDKEQSVKLVIMKGTGGKAFCCGGDVRALTESGKVCGPLSHEFFREEYTLDHLTSVLSVPYIALIDGVTMGGGVGLSVHGRYRVATETTLFAMPETAIGLFPDVGGGHFLPRLAGSVGMYLALTGHRLRGRDVYTAGIATHFVESSQIGNLEQDLLQLRSTTHADVDGLLRSYHNKCRLDLDKPFALDSHIEKINSIFGHQTLEEIFDSLRQDGSEWSTTQLATLNKMSPTSMKVTLRLLMEGAKLTLAEDLKTEYRLSQRFILDKDFYEGVRAVLVDRDQNPKWDPAHIEDVTRDKLDWYFSPLPDGQQELILQ